MKAQDAVALGFIVAGAAGLLYYFTRGPKIKPVRAGQTVGVAVKWKNIGIAPISQRWRTTVEDSALLATPQEGPWTVYQIVDPGKEATVSPETQIPSNWGPPMKVNLRLDTDGSVDKSGIKFWKEYFEIIKKT